MTTGARPDLFRNAIEAQLGRTIGAGKIGWPRRTLPASIKV